MFPAKKMQRRKRMNSTLQPHKKNTFLGAARIEHQGYTYFSVYGDSGIARSMSCPIFSQTRSTSPGVSFSAGEIFASTQLLHTLGKSSTSQVFIGRNINTSEYLTVKLIDTSKKQGQEAAKREAQYYSANIKHPSIVEYYGIKLFEQCAMVYQEYFCGIDLFDLLMGCKEISVEVIKRIFIQLVSAVSYLHKHRVCHLDIKLENILVDRKCDIKLIDFGMSQVALKNGLVEAYGGSLHYAAPEAEQGGVYNGFLADSWSCGVVLFVMANKCFPKRANKSQHLPSTPKFIISAVNSLLVVNPEKRSPISSFQAQNKDFYTQEGDGK